MTSIRALRHFAEVVIFVALSTTCYLQHLRLQDTKPNSSQTAQERRPLNTVIAASKHQVARAEQSVPTSPLAGSAPDAPAESRGDDHRNEGALAKHLERWLQNVRALADFAERNPELTIPQIALLNEQDWLDVARDKLESEDDFRSALAKLRDLGRRKVAPDIGSALKAAMSAAGGRTPESPRNLIPYLPPGFNVAILDRFVIDPSGPIDERVPTRRFVLLERPVDAADQPLMFNTFGSPGRNRGDSSK